MRFAFRIRLPRFAVPLARDHAKKTETGVVGDSLENSGVVRKAGTVVADKTRQ